jgi:hypothetical protein
MKYLFIILLLFIGVAFSVNAQDKLVLKNGRTIEVNIIRTQDTRVEYTYPGETSVYERPKSAISYIIYKDGRTEYTDESARPAQSRTRTSSSSTTPSQSASSSSGDDRTWQDVKATFMESDVNGLKRLKRVTASSKISYKDAISQLKKKTAEMGGNTVLVMDDAEDSGASIEVMGIAYLDESTGAISSPVSPQRSSSNVSSSESDSNVRRRRIAQQMGSYSDDSQLEYQDNTKNTSQSTSRSSQTASRQPSVETATPDAVHLMSGRVIRGIIEEFEPDDFVSIRTPNNKIVEYSMDDVKSISRGSSKKSSQQASRQPTTRRNTDFDDEIDDNDEYDKYNSRRSSGTQRQEKNYNDYSESGYKGTFDVGYALHMTIGEKGAFELSTSHGYQINKYLFIGAGVGLNMYSARDPQLYTNIGSTTNDDKFPQYVGTIANGKTELDNSVTYMHAVDSSYMVLPVFLDVRAYLPINDSPIIPYAMFKIGYSFNLSDGFGNMGMYMNPSIGAKYRISPALGINFSVGYTYQKYGGIPKDGGYGFYYYDSATDKASPDNIRYVAKGAGGINFKLGVEF